MEDTKAERASDAARRFLVVFLLCFGFFAVLFYTQARYGQPARAALVTPTAAVAALGGQITDTNGEPVEGVTVSLLDSDSGETYAATTNGKGRFVFETMPVGRVYVLTPQAKRYSFNPSSRVVSHMDVTENANFTAESKRKTRRARK